MRPTRARRSASDVDSASTAMTSAAPAFGLESFTVPASPRVTSGGAAVLEIRWKRALPILERFGGSGTRSSTTSTSVATTEPFDVTVLNSSGVAGRAEEVARDPAHRGGYDLVTARSFGAPAVTAECAAPLLRVGGELLVSEPPEATTSERWPRDGLAELGLGGPERQVVDASGVPVHLVRLVLEEACGERYPRRVGVPSKRPLF